MSMQPATQSSNQLGRTLGTSRDWPRRLRLHHLPLGLASAVVLFLFMTLPLEFAEQSLLVPIGDDSV